MNPAEEIVKFWLQEKGYFVQSSIKVGRKEIDILAIHKQNKKDRRYIEVSASINMVDFTNTAKTRAQVFNVKKFLPKELRKEVKERLGTNFYTREIVIGDVKLKKKAGFEEFRKECKKLGIKAWYFGDILNEVVPRLGTKSHLNPIIWTLQLNKRFICSEKVGTH